jgi:hypothetical protein
MFSAKVIGPLLTGTGSLILAWRVKQILDALILAQKGAEVNFLSIFGFYSGKTKDLRLLGDFDAHVERAQKLGTFLLVVGFLLIAAGSFTSALVALGVF